jgi:inosose dehydratase
VTGPSATAGRARVAGAPISWGVCEVRRWGYQLGPGRVLAEMRGLGLRATEAGPDGFLPGAPAALRAELAGHELGLVGSFVPLVLHRPAGWQRPLRRAVTRIAAAGGEVVVLAAATGLDGYDMRPALDDHDWRRLLAALGEAAEVAAGRGLRAVLHPHVGTVVERPDEIDRVLAGTEVSLCLDTGHIMAGGGDPAWLARRHPDRIGHVHLKDVRAAAAHRVAAGLTRYGAAVRDGLYCPLGDGDVDVPAITSALQTAGYHGWYVLEQDVMLDAEPPPGAGPLTQVGRSLWFLRQTLAGVPGATG